MRQADIGTRYLCLRCRIPLTPGALRQQRATGRLICHRCHLGEVREVQGETLGPWMTWEDALVVAGLLGLVVAAWGLWRGWL